MPILVHSQARSIFAVFSRNFFSREPTVVFQHVVMLIEIAVALLAELFCALTIELIVMLTGAPEQVVMLSTLAVEHVVMIM